MANSFFPGAQQHGQDGQPQADGFGIPHPNFAQQNNAGFPGGAFPPPPPQGNMPTMADMAQQFAMFTMFNAQAQFDQNQRTDANLNTLTANINDLANNMRMLGLNGGNRNGNNNNAGVYRTLKPKKDMTKIKAETAREHMLEMAQLRLI